MKEIEILRKKEKENTKAYNEIKETLKKYEIIADVIHKILASENITEFDKIYIIEDFLAKPKRESDITVFAKDLEWIWE